MYLSLVSTLTLPIPCYPKEILPYTSPFWERLPKKVGTSSYFLPSSQPNGNASSKRLGIFQQKPAFSSQNQPFQPEMLHLTMKKKIF